MTNQQLAHALWQVSQQSFQYGSPWTLQQFVEDLEQGSSSWLLEKNADDELIGYLQYRVLFDEAEIYNLAIATAYKGQGLGRQLMMRLDTELGAQAVAQIFLEVRESNQLARAFYQKQGFVEVSTRKNYYHHPLENGLILMKELK
ncbi:ribosomal protein S18-alanine N-acetyltransferase [Vagococcus zengguangii]|uniref:ribosomal protein S18-alanine N-acetyltransferase n=1 Tax=Vagococcus zengguangii TaxID=2571750 RepID=UPI0012B0647B|nr:ribosomal protein S18-alanine N-acetyltransferase [Vagococcus zengguangii]